MRPDDTCTSAILYNNVSFTKCTQSTPHNSTHPQTKTAIDTMPRFITVGIFLPSFGPLEDDPLEDDTSEDNPLEGDDPLEIQKDIHVKINDTNTYGHNAEFGHSSITY